MKRFFIIMVAALTALSFSSCEKYEDGRPAKSVRNTFKDMYPDAHDVEWELQGAYWNVSFETGSRLNGIDHEAWYDKSGNWVATETEVYLNEVPETVKTALSTSEFGNYGFSDNDAEFWQTPETEFYRFDLQGNVNVDVTVNGEVSRSTFYL